MASAVDFEQKQTVLTSVSDSIANLFDGRRIHLHPICNRRVKAIELEPARCQTFHGFLQSIFRKVAVIDSDGFRV